MVALLLVLLTFLTTCQVSVLGVQTVEMADMLPVVINTWAFSNATAKAWQQLTRVGSTVVDAVVAGCTACEEEQCDHTVGWGGSPDESGETTLDAMVMDGATLNVGAVGGLRRVKGAVAVARRVLDHTAHSLLVGDRATDFAVAMGFPEENLTSKYSANLHSAWKDNNCQPNFWVNVAPDPARSCGPYKPEFGAHNHDTIGMVAVDEAGNLASATSSNGAKHKIPGRVGDSPIPGAGSYADNDIGGAAATGDGDVMMRLLPSFVAVEEMRRGATPADAAETAIRRIATKYPSFQGAVVALRKDGKFGAACCGMTSFPYCVRTPSTGDVIVSQVDCITI